MKTDSSHVIAVNRMGSDFPDYFIILKKRKWTILTIFIIVVLSVSLATLSVKPVYEATAKIIIDREDQKIFSFEGIFPVQSTQMDYFQTQLKVMGSRSLAKKVFDKLSLANDARYRSENDPLGLFKCGIRIEPVRNTRLASIIVRDHSPQRSARIANTFAQVYIDDNLERKLSASRYAIDWLTQQLLSVKRKIEKAEKALHKYVTDNNISYLPKIEEGGNQQGLIQQLEIEKARLEGLIAENSSRYKEKHPQMIRLHSSLATVNERLQQEIQSILFLNSKSAKFSFLKREVDSNQQLYDTILAKSKESDVFEGLRVNNISLVDPAEIPAIPVYPNKLQNLILACALGLILGFGLAFLLESLDTTLRGTEDVQSCLGYPVLGSVPENSKLKAKLKPGEIYVGSFLDTQSPFAESYRFIRASLFFSSVEKPIHSLLITSTCPKEGKTTDAINIGITLAASGEKILLVDADMRNPTVHRIFQFGDVSGLSNILSGNGKPDDIIKETKVPNLYVMPSGPCPVNPAELLESPKMREFLAWAQGRFSKVIIDSPPVLAVADPLILSAYAEGVLFVVRSGMTTRKQALQAITKLSTTQVKIFGILVNRVKPTSEGYNNPYYYNYYGKKNTKKDRLKTAV